MTDIDPAVPELDEVLTPVRDDPNGVAYVETDPSVLASAGEPTTIPSPAMPPRASTVSDDDE